MYAQIIDNDCIPLTEIPVEQQESFARDYLLRDRFVDIDLMQCADHASDLPYLSACTSTLMLSIQPATQS